MSIWISGLVIAYQNHIPFEHLKTNKDHKYLCGNVYALFTGEANDTKGTSTLISRKSGDNAMANEQTIVYKTQHRN